MCPTVRLGGPPLFDPLFVYAASNPVSVAGPKVPIFVAGADVMSSTSAKYGVIVGRVLTSVRSSPGKKFEETVCENVIVT